MRAGKIARIRVNPGDCMSTVDLCKVAGLNPGAMNFSQCVSAAYSTLLEMCRKRGTIPRRDGFEYLDMMGSLKETPSASDRAERAITAPRSPATDIVVDTPAMSDVERDSKDRRWTELGMRRAMNSENMTEDENAEFVQLCKDLGYQVPT